jgi:hypothetical protein
MVGFLLAKVTALAAIRNQSSECLLQPMYALRPPSPLSLMHSSREKESVAII